MQFRFQATNRITESAKNVIVEKARILVFSDEVAGDSSSFNSTRLYMLTKDIIFFLSYVYIKVPSRK